MKVKADVYVDDESYCVVADSMEVLGREGTYIVHMEGNPLALFRLSNKYKKDIFGDTDTYFMVKDQKYFRNHMTPTDIEGLYIWKEK